VEPPAGDCVKAGVGGSLDSDVGAFEAGGVWSSDLDSVCARRVSQHAIMHNLRDETSPSADPATSIEQHEVDCLKERPTLGETTYRR
jgi:hypothetical protein